MNSWINSPDGIRSKAMPFSFKLASCNIAARITNSCRAQRSLIHGECNGRSRRMSCCCLRTPSVVPCDYLWLDNSQKAWQECKIVSIVICSPRLQSWYQTLCESTAHALCDGAAPWQSLVSEPDPSQGSAWFQAELEAKRYSWSNPAWMSSQLHAVQKIIPVLLRSQ